MPHLQVRVPHTLTQQEAQQRLARFVELLHDSYGHQVTDLDQAWQDDTLRFRFKAYGFQLAGTITLADHELDVRGDLPFSALIFRGRIESAIREQLTRLMAT